MNPYFDATFFSWFHVLGKRFFECIQNAVCGEPIVLYSEEIQLITLLCFASIASFLGSFLVLKGATMMANALSHTMLLGIVMAYMGSLEISNPHLLSLIPSTSALCIGAFLSTCLTIAGIALFSLSRLIPSDAANGVVSTFLFAVAITIISLVSKDVHVGTEIFLGNADMLSREDMTDVLYLSLITGVIGILCFRGFVLSTFDSVFSSLSGMKPLLFDRLILFLSGISIISSFRAIGLVLALVFFVIPPLIARIYTHEVGSMIRRSQLIAILACFIGIALSRHIVTVYSLSLSTSALISFLLSIQLIVSLVVKEAKQKKKKEKRVEIA